MLLRLARMDPFPQILVVGCCAFTVYYNTAFGGFVFDDSEAIRNNKDVIPSTPLQNIFFHDFWGTDMRSNVSHKSYRPLTILSYRLNYIFNDNQLNAAQYHVTNVCGYILLCMMVLQTFRLLDFNCKDDIIFDSAENEQANPQYVAERKEVYFYASMMFAVHPVHTEAVAPVVGRADILSGIAFLLALMLYRHFVRNNSPVLFVIICMVIFAGVLCKETAITVVGVCMVYDVLYTRLKMNNKLEKVFTNKQYVYRTIGLMIFSLLVIYFRLWIMNFEAPIFAEVDNPAAFSKSLFTRIFTFNYIYFLNLLILIWPQWLCFDWSMGCIPLIEDYSDIRIIFVIILWFFVGTTAYVVIKRFLRNKIDPTVVMGFALLVIPFIPASNFFVNVGFVIAERTLLLPSMGYCLLLLLGYKKLEKLNPQWQESQLILKMFYGLFVIYAFRTLHRNVDWQTELELFTSAQKVCPLNAKVHFNIGKVVADLGDKKTAVDYYRRAIDLHPDYEQAMNNLANLLRDQEKFRDAEQLLRKAVKVRPNFAAAWMNLGIVLTSLEEFEEAEECYMKALSFRTKYPDCYYNLGTLYLDMHRNEDALKAFENAVAYRPNHASAWRNMLVLLETMHQFDKVVILGKEALKHNPDSDGIHFCIGNTMGKMGEFALSEKHFLEALKLSPHNALYYSNLGVLYHRWGKYKKAKKMYLKALHFEPEMESALNNLKQIMNVV